MVMTNVFEALDCTGADYDGIWERRDDAIYGGTVIAPLPSVSTITVTALGWLWCLVPFYVLDRGIAP
jgi:hypothetical protein